MWSQNMKRSGIIRLALALATASVLPQTALASVWIPTNTGIGADAEVRESIADQARGASTEIAMRVLDQDSVSDRNSAIYLRFDLSGVSAVPGFETALRMTYRNNNLTEARIHDLDPPDSGLRAGFQVYGLDPAAAGVNWGETTITYKNAPGITPDGNVGTKDLNSDLMLLGEILFPAIGDQNHLPVGGELIFQSALLDQFLFDALTAGASSITLVTSLIHDGMPEPSQNWNNFNYLFNPKEQTTLNTDAGYDADVNDAGNALGSPFSGADNSTGAFSPSLLVDARQVAEPATVGLLVLALTGVAGLRRRARSRSPARG
jgi:hypothetical protein